MQLNSERCSNERAATSARSISTTCRLVDSARELRKTQTPAEIRFWDAVRNRASYSFRIRRQHPIGTYVLDFWIPAYQLAIELDGAIHLEDDITAQDRVRTEWLESRGISVLRFSNAEIFDNLEAVLQAIDDHIRELTRKHPS